MGKEGRKVISEEREVLPGTEDALKVVLQGLGLSGWLNTCAGYLGYPLMKIEDVCQEH